MAAILQRMGLPRLQLHRTEHQNATTLREIKLPLLEKEPQSWRVALWKSEKGSPVRSPRDRDYSKHCPSPQRGRATHVSLTLPRLHDNRYLSGITQVHFHSKLGSWKGCPKLHNQDSYFDVSRDESRLIGVCDGHGPKGHHVSQFIVERLPAILYRKVALKATPSTSAALIEAYAGCAQLLSDSSIDTTQSGSTCLSLLIVEQTLLCASVGDSRAVVGRKICGIWGVYQLSWDHTADNCLETARITECGGEVTPPKKSRLKHNRIYLKDTLVPGLSLTRSLGDSIAASIGVTAEPDIEVLTLSNYDKFVLVGTRGLWEVMDSIEAVRIVGEIYEREPETVPERLVQEAQRRWRARGQLVDDVTVGLAVIGSKSPSTYSVSVQCSLSSAHPRLFQVAPAPFHTVPRKAGHRQSADFQFCSRAFQCVLQWKRKALRRGTETSYPKPQKAHAGCPLLRRN